MKAHSHNLYFAHVSCLYLTQAVICISHSLFFSGSVNLNIMEIRACAASLFLISF